jgi:hypothetical protein
MTDPNATSRMMTAARMPRSSLSGNANGRKSWPPYSTWSPGAATPSPRSLIASASLTDSDWPRLV